MLPRGMIEIRLDFVREQIKKLETRQTDDIKKRALKKWQIAEYELMLILEDSSIQNDTWLMDGSKKHLQRTTDGLLETDHEKIFHRYMHEFGLDNSWYAQHLCSLKHIGGDSIVNVNPENEQLLYNAYNNLKKAVEGVERRREGFYLCMGCREEVNKHKVGLNLIEGQEYCDDCSKKVEGNKFPQYTDHDCQQCLHKHYQNEKTGEAVGCSYAGCGCKDYDGGGE